MKNESMDYGTTLGIIMTTMNSEMYEALVEAGATPEKASAAAKAMADKENLATKEDLLRLENKILLWMGTMFLVNITILATLMKIL